MIAVEACPRTSVRQDRVGVGIGRGHHGEIVQGAFQAANGLTVPGLLTMPCPLLSSRVQFAPNSSGQITAFGVESPPGSPYAKTVTAAEIACSFIGIAGLGGDLRLESNIPGSKGCGSSTADVVGTIRAVADSAGVQVTGAEIARIAVQAELASDSVMFDMPVLFAQTCGAVLDRYNASLPSFSVIGFDSAPESEIDTLDIERPVYDAADLDTFALLRSGLRHAIRAGDASVLGKIASASTRIAMKHNPNDRVQEVMASAGRLGCLGVQVAHSGTVAGIMMPAGNGELAAEDHITQTAEKVSALIGGPVWIFDVQPE
jgi:uncharacterized protein involved in propanediol utilization